MSELGFFDCNAQIGRYGVKHPEAFTTADALAEEMARVGVSEALVYHSMAKEYAPKGGNQMLLDEIEARDSMHPCWVVMPHHTGEMPRPDHFLVQMEQSGVRALRAFPVAHSWRLTDWCACELLDMLESNRIPLFLDMDQTNWDIVAELLKAHRRLHLCLLRTSYRGDRMMYPLLEAFDGLKIETATYAVPSGIEEVTRRFGAGRLLFGTGLPLTEAGPSIAQIAYADISDADKRLIAGDNLRSLLKWEG